MQPLLSIIIPVYNGEEYLGNCLERIARQTLHEENYEVFIMDDASSDNTLTVASGYCLAHPNTRVIPLPERTPGGVGTIANMGIRMAGGKYVLILDHDDSPCPEMFTTLTSLAEADEADVTFCSFAMDAGGELLPPYDEVYWQQLFEPGFTSLSLEERKERYLKISPVYWRKLINRNFLARNKITFPTGDFSSEDMVFHWRTVLFAERFAVTNKRLITYRLERAGKLTHQDIVRKTGYQIHHLQTVKAMLLQRNVYATYRPAFMHAAADVLSRVPEDHPARATITEALADICGGL